MRNTQRIKEFIKKWENNLPNKQVLYDYAPFCKNLLYEDEEIVRETTNLLKKNIDLWAHQNSCVYADNFDQILTKEKLLEKSNWYIKEFGHESTSMSTSGSTTGLPFSYLRWDPFFEFIEGTNHYDLVLNEFEIDENPNILYLFDNSYKFEDFLLPLHKNDIIKNHGIERNSKVYLANTLKYKNNEEELFKKLLKYLSKNHIDVILTSGPFINSLCYYIKKFKNDNKICKLLSNTNELLLQKDADFLIKNQYVENICDHMRCWDGGASFFTCSYKNYHLLDNLIWCEEKENKLISTDYFSFPSPFVNYWNGDYCQIKNIYKRCECGRLYREFKFLENRPFSLKGICFKEIQDKIKKININYIKQVKCDTNQIAIVSTKELSNQEKEQISAITNKFQFIFKTEKEC